MSAEVKLSRRQSLGRFAHRPVSPLHHRLAISDTGTWMQVMAQGWVMSTLTNKAILLGMVNLAAGLPMLVLTYDRRLGSRSIR